MARVLVGARFFCFLKGGSVVVDVGVCVEGGAAAGWSYAEVDEWGGKAGDRGGVPH